MLWACQQGPFASCRLAQSESGSDSSPRRSLQIRRAAFRPHAGIARPSRPSFSDRSFGVYLCCVTSQTAEDSASPEDPRGGVASTKEDLQRNKSLPAIFSLPALPAILLLLGNAVLTRDALLLASFFGLQVALPLPHLRRLGLTAYNALAASSTVVFLAWAAIAKFMPAQHLQAVDVRSSITLPLPKLLVQNANKLAASRPSFMKAALSKSMIKSPIMLPAALLVIFLGINALILKKLHGRGKAWLGKESLASPVATSTDGGTTASYETSVPSESDAKFPIDILESSDSHLLKNNGPTALGEKHEEAIVLASICQPIKSEAAGTSANARGTSLLPSASSSNAANDMGIAASEVVERGGALVPISKELSPRMMQQSNPGNDRDKDIEDVDTIDTSCLEIDSGVIERGGLTPADFKRYQDSISFVKTHLTNLEEKYDSLEKSVPWNSSVEAVEALKDQVHLLAAKIGQMGSSSKGIYKDTFTSLQGIKANIATLEAAQEKAHAQDIDLDRRMQQQTSQLQAMTTSQEKALDTLQSVDSELRATKQEVAEGKSRGIMIDEKLVVQDKEVQRLADEMSQFNQQIADVLQQSAEAEKRVTPLEGNCQTLKERSTALDHALAAFSSQMEEGHSKLAQTVDCAKMDAQRYFSSKDYELKTMGTDIKNAKERSSKVSAELSVMKQDMQESFTTVDARYATYNTSMETIMAELKNERERLGKDLEAVRSLCSTELNTQNGPDCYKVVDSMQQQLKLLQARVDELADGSKKTALERPSKKGKKSVKEADGIKPASSPTARDGSDMPVEKNVVKPTIANAAPDGFDIAVEKLEVKPTSTTTAPDGFDVAMEKLEVKPTRTHTTPDGFDVAVEKLEVKPTSTTTAPDGFDVAVEKLEVQPTSTPTAPDGFDVAVEKLGVKPTNTNTTTAQDGFDVLVEKLED